MKQKHLKARTSTAKGIQIWQIMWRNWHYKGCVRQKVPHGWVSPSSFLLTFTLWHRVYWQAASSFGNSCSNGELSSKELVAHQLLGTEFECPANWGADDLGTEQADEGISDGKRCLHLQVVRSPNTSSKKPQQSNIKKKTKPKNQPLQGCSLWCRRKPVQDKAWFQQFDKFLVEKIKTAVLLS